MVQQGGKHQTQTVLDLIVNVNYLDKKSGHSGLFLLESSKQTECLFSLLKIGEMLFCCNTDVLQNFVSFTFYDVIKCKLRKKSSHCVFACTCMYIAWKGVLLVM